MLDYLVWMICVVDTQLPKPPAQHSSHRDLYSVIGRLMLFFLRCFCSLFRVLFLLLLLVILIIDVFTVIDLWWYSRIRHPTLIESF